MYPVLDHGFVCLKECMGSDESIEQAARVSYGKGTRKKSDTRNLIRYLVRNSHSSPLEMAEVKFYIAMPIFCMRQFVRHRTQNLNEYSARYSEVPDVWYVPTRDELTKQSQKNKQGSTEEHVYSQEEYNKTMAEYNLRHQDAFATYKKMLTDGVSREMARTVLPVSVYTTIYTKFDLRNLLHLLSLRADGHAQWQIRQYAYVMGAIVKELFPITFEAWMDYVFNATNFSAQEMQYLKVYTEVKSLEQISEFDDKMCVENFGLSEKEFVAFQNKLKKLPENPFVLPQPKSKEDFLLCVK